MKYKGHVETDKVGSECEFEFEIDDSEVEGMDPGERQRYIEEIAKEEALQYVEWDYSESK